MRFARRTRLAIVVAWAEVVALAIQPARSSAADPPCATVVAPRPLPASWAARVEELKGVLAQAPRDECSPISFSIEPAEGGVRIVGIAPDGRRAQRVVTHEESLVAVVQGLMFRIPGESVEPPRTLDAPPATAPTAPAPPTSPSPPPPGTPETSATRAGSPMGPRTLSLWTGLSAGIRFMAPTSASVLDVEARTDVLIRSWLLLLSIRSALLSCVGQQGLDCDVYTDASLGLGVGRRFVAGGQAIDLAVAPSIVVMNMEYDFSVEKAAIESTEVALRVDGSARLAVPLGPSWAFTVTLEGGVAPSIVASPKHLTLPTSGSATPLEFPGWSGGLRLGASGALL